MLRAALVMGEPGIARVRRLPRWEWWILFLRACARRTTALFLANQVLPACAACNLGTGEFGFCARARAAPRDSTVMGELGIVRARRLQPWEWRIGFL